MRDDHDSYETKYAAYILSLALTITLILFAWWLLGEYFQFLDRADLVAISGPSIFPAPLFHPEGVEKLQYAAALLLFPPLAFAFMKLFLRRLGGKADRFLAAGFSALSLLAALVLYALAFVDLGDSDYSPYWYYLRGHPLLTILFFSSLITAILAYRRLREGRIKRLAGRVFAYGPLLASLLLALATPGILIFSARQMSLFNASMVHFNAYFYSVSQVCAGKALLRDLTNQYGLYPQFLEPVFFLIGLNVDTFMIVMGVLTGISLLGIWIFLAGVVKNRLILFAGMAASLCVIGMPLRLYVSPYFQYIPHRMLFPCLLLALSLFYHKRETKYLYYLSFAISSLAVLWNIDTGIVVFAAWLLVLLYGDVLRYRGRAALAKMLRDIAVGALFLGGTLAAFIIYMCARYGAFPRFWDLLTYQSFFYSSGFYLLPMEPIGPWNLVALAYAGGLAYALLALARGKDSLKAKMVLLLSLIGAGLFSYYQGRSHPAVLLFVSYPAVLLAAIFADGLYRRVLGGSGEKKYPVAEALVLAGLLFFLMAASLSLVLNDDLGTKISDSLAPGRYDASAAVLSSGTDFIKKYASPGEEVLILSYGSGPYYAGSHTSSPLGVPGFYEVIFRRDMDKVADFLKGDDPRSHKVFFDPAFRDEGAYASMAYNSVMTDVLLDNYAAVDKSTYNGMILYVKDPDRKGYGIRRSLNVSDGGGPGIIFHATYDNGTFSYLSSDGPRAFLNCLMKNIAPGDHYSIGVLLKPGDRQVPRAAIASSIPATGAPEGFELSYVDDERVLYRYGNGRQLVSSLTITLRNNETSYLVIAADGTTIKAYVNGIFANSSGQAGAVQEGGVPMTLGNRATHDGPFAGDIYDMAVVDHALEENEIISNMGRLGLAGDRH